MIFTQFYDTLHYLKGQLGSRWRVGTFHGSLRPQEKDQAINQFRSGATQILISTEAGGEGRNLQFCAVLVNYDLPWNPMKVEQRIGRVDRIGQKRDVLICNFAQRGTVEDRVLDMLSHRIHIFEETVGGLDPILGELESDIQKIVLETPLDQLDAALDRRAAQLERDTDRARQLEEAQRDFVVDLRSFNRQAQVVFDQDEQRRLLQAMQTWSRLMLKQVGAQVERQDDGSLSVKLGKASGGILPEVRQRYFDITFDYQQAMESQGFEYGSFGHSLFDALIAYGTSETFGRGAVTQRTIRSDAHDAFTGFQFNFVVEEQSVHTTPSLVVIAIDDDGNHRADITGLLLESREWEQPTSGTVDNGGTDWTGQVERAHMQAEAVLNRLLKERHAQRKAEYEPMLQAEEQRINRYCDMRLRSGQEKLQHDQAILQRLQWSGREEDRKVVPIWKRNVENAEAYIRSIVTERETQLKELAGRRQVTYSWTLLNAARVTVVVPIERHTISFQRTTRRVTPTRVNREAPTSTRKPRVKPAAPVGEQGPIPSRASDKVAETPTAPPPRSRRRQAVSADKSDVPADISKAASTFLGDGAPTLLSSSESVPTPAPQPQLATEQRILVTPPPSDTPVIQIPPPAPQKESLFKLPPPSTVVESKHSSSGSGSDLAAKLGLKDVVRFVRKKLRKLF